MKTKTKTFHLAVAVALGVSHAAAQPASPDVAIYKKIDAQIKQMTLEEKVGMLHANSSFTSGGVPRLGIPENVTLTAASRASKRPQWRSATGSPNAAALPAVWIFTG